MPEVTQSLKGPKSKHPCVLIVEDGKPCGLDIPEHKNGHRDPRKKGSPPWVEERPNPDGSFDELVFKNVNTVHFEMMDDNQLWIGIYHNGDNQGYHVNVGARGKLRINHYDA